MIGWSSVSWSLITVCVLSCSVLHHAYKLEQRSFVGPSQCPDPRTRWKWWPNTSCPGQWATQFFHTQWWSLEFVNYTEIFLIWLQKNHPGNALLLGFAAMLSLWLQLQWRQVEKFHTTWIDQKGGIYPCNVHWGICIPVMVDHHSEQVCFWMQILYPILPLYWFICFAFIIVWQLCLMYMLTPLHFYGILEWTLPLQVPLISDWPN